jgi:Neuraminidase (sialidase)
MKGAAAFVLACLHMAAEGPVTVKLLPPGPGNPRNSEGDFARLKDGRILFVYTKFATEGPGDSGAAALAARYSMDGGVTWTTKDETILSNEAGLNVMSVSLLRLASGELALFYLRKESLLDCRPYMRVSKDEGQTWSEARATVREPGYYVLNNDRARQLKSGRIVLPVALHRNRSAEFADFERRGVAMCYLSDDNGRSWRRSRTMVESADRNGLQEPGVVELKDGRVLMYMRTGMGSQYFSVSQDGGETWTGAQASSLQSPLSPATIERIPKTGDLLAVWNDQSKVSAEIRNRKRTPLTVAISRDEGRTWERAKNLMDDPAGWYCYTAVEFADDRVLLGFSAGGAGLAPLSRTVITSFALDWLYR